MTTTPHHVGQVAKAEILVADALERWGLTEPTERAAWLLAQLQTELGWTPPKDLTEAPPLTGRGADPDHRAACMDEIRSVFNRPATRRTTLA